MASSSLCATLDTAASLVGEGLALVEDGRCQWRSSVLLEEGLCGDWERRQVREMRRIGVVSGKRDAGEVREICEEVRGIKE